MAEKPSNAELSKRSFVKTVALAGPGLSLLGTAAAQKDAESGVKRAASRSHQRKVRRAIERASPSSLEEAQELKRGDA